jgi:hypothetical protein
MEYDQNISMVHYEHDANCDQKTFTQLNDRGLKTCLQCAGVFDAAGKGVRPDDYRFDKNYPPPDGPVPVPSKGS